MKDSETVTGERRYIPELTSLRALAALGIVFHHATVLTTTLLPSIVRSLGETADIGVAVFFVLSGYLVFRPFVETPVNRIGSFVANRFARVMIPYWCVLVVLLVAGVVTATGQGELLAYVTLTNSFIPDHIFGGIVPAWSIAVEMTFYLLVPVFGMISHSLRKKYGTFGPLGLVGCLVVVGHVFRIVVTTVDINFFGAPLDGISFLWLPTHIDLFAAGMAIAIVDASHLTTSLSIDRRTAATGSMVLAVVLYIAYSLSFGAPSINEGYSLLHLEVRQLVYTAVGALVVGGIVFGTLPRPVARAMNSTLLIGLGLVSYGLYLIHHPLMVWFANNGHSGAVALATVGLVGGIGLAALLYHLVEKPVDRLRRSPARLRDWATTMSETERNVGAWLIVLVAACIPLRGLLLYQGPPMEEGFMLVFPEQILLGNKPHVDFLHLYGPGSLWMLAGIYKVFGTDLFVERIVGFLQHLMCVGGVFLLCRQFGRRIATCSALTALVIILTPLGLSALAYNGALGFALLGFAAAARAQQDDLQRRTYAVVTGVCGAIALLFRPDMVLGVGAGYLVVLTALSQKQRVALIASSVSTSLLYVVHIAWVGPTNAFNGMFVQPVFDLRAGRTLPIPPSTDELDGFLQRAGGLRVVGWPLPMPPVAWQVNLWFWVLIATAVFLVITTVGFWSNTRLRTVFGAPAVFGVMMTTQAFQRPDTAHLSWVTAVTFALLTPAVYLWLKRGVVAKNAGSSIPISTRLGLMRWGSMIPVVFVLVVVIPFYPLRTYVDLSGQSMGNHQFGFEIRRGDRVFYYGDQQAADDAQRVVDLLDERAVPGNSLIVAPHDLSKTPYVDSFLYYLFPELEVGTRYIEMDPGIADAKDSGLAEEVANADFLILSSTWDGWVEPNESTKAGSTEPNDIVAKEFCVLSATASEASSPGDRSLESDTPKFQLLGRCG